MKNQRKQYQTFEDQEPEAYTRGIPVGHPQNPQQTSQNTFVQASFNQAHIPQQYLPQQNPQVIAYFQPQPYFQQQPYAPQYPPQFNQPVQAVQPQQTFNSKVYDQSVNVKCQCCKYNVQTMVAKETGNVTSLWAVAIWCIFGSCCCVPWLVDSCLDKTHYCPNCGQSVIRKHARCFDIFN